jgi:mono/diheme cytochrome c family protein
MKNVLILSALCWLLASCSGNDSQKTASTDTPAAAGSTDIEKYDPERGTGKFTNVDVPPTLDQAMATAGQKVADVKCASCHKLTDEKLVGPGWKGVTQRHKPEWIMNFVTNVDDMLAKDPKAQAMLEICLVRMPNQNLTDEDARSVYEFMRKNDGVK